MQVTQTNRLPRWIAAILNWFDSSVGGHAPRSNAAHAQRIDWLRVVPFFGVHAMCLGVIWVGWSPIAVGVAAAMYLVRMFAITAFYHRYFSHRTFKTSRPAQFLFALLGSSSVQRGPLWWAAHHRHHHAHSDEPEDVHSPHTHGFLWSHMGWILTRSNYATDLAAVPDLARYRELVFLDRFDTLVPILLGTAMFFLGVLLNALAPGLGTSGAQMLVWGFFISTVLLFHGTCTINSLAHLIGRRRYPTSDQSRNSFALALITLGEGWHNNHHYHQTSVRQGFRWWEIDITYYGLVLMSWLGVVWDLKPVPERVKRFERCASAAGG